jgi:MFS family permease
MDWRLPLSVRSDRHCKVRGRSICRALILGAVASFYVVGAVTGALGFGWITDRFGRRLVFYVTLIVYLTGVLLSALAWDFWSFALFRMVTGLGIGGEYAAVNSAIDELIPAKYRGRIDLVVNGSFWLGAAAGALAAPVLLDQNLLPVNVGWRLGFGIGGVLGFSILMLRRFVPESPRWLVTHCRWREAEETVKRIEADVVRSTGRNLPPAQGSLAVHPRKVFGLGLILTAMLGRYRQRSILALTLMVAQSFLYNSVFFTFGLIIANFYHVPDEQVGLYLFPLAIGNFCGPLLLGPLFDTVGRRMMIAGTFALSGVLLLVTAYSLALACFLPPPRRSPGASYSFLHRLPPVRPTSQQAKYFPSKRERWPLPASTRSAQLLAAALRPFYSVG